MVREFPTAKQPLPHARFYSPGMGLPEIWFTSRLPGGLVFLSFVRQIFRFAQLIKTNDLCRISPGSFDSYKCGSSGRRRRKRLPSPSRLSRQPTAPAEWRPFLKSVTILRRVLRPVRRPGKHGCLGYKEWGANEAEESH